jgi:antitoxin (DNA-binding transcriptional repressor) of toxin-antitoxin stability system
MSIIKEAKVNSVTITNLRNRGQIAARIENGESLVITRDGKPVALIKPYRKGDKGERAGTAVFYPKVAKYVDKALKGKSTIMLRHGEAFATLCKYEPKAKATKRRPKRRAKAPAKKVETKAAAKRSAPKRRAKPADPTWGGAAVWAGGN